MDINFNVKTEKNNLKVEVFCKFINKNKIKVNKEFFEKMCKEGCGNYGKKYSCPPYTPCFENLIRNYEGLFIVVFKTELDKIDSTQYNKTRIANVILKSRILKLMRYLERKHNCIFLSNGSCNLCKPCKLKLKLTCQYPEKRRYSLESIGIDCDFISKELFGISLVWYKDKKAPEHSVVMCGLPCNEKEIENLKKNVEEWIKENC